MTGGGNVEEIEWIWVLWRWQDHQTSVRCIQTANWHVKFKMYGFLTALWRKTADFSKRKHVSPKPVSGECDEASSWSWVHCQCSCSLIFTLLRLIKTVSFYSSGEKTFFESRQILTLWERTQDGWSDIFLFGFGFLWAFDWMPQPTC